VPDEHQDRLRWPLKTAQSLSLPRDSPLAGRGCIEWQPGGILAGEDRLPFEGPANIEYRIVPEDAPLMRGGVICGGFVEEFRRI